MIGWLKSMFGPAAPPPAPIPPVADKPAWAFDRLNPMETHGRGGLSPFDNRAVRHRADGVPMPPPGVIPAGATLAMDDATTAQTVPAVMQWAQGALWGEGLAFLGYPYLAELSQRPEYRHIVETWAEEQTRKWVDLETTGDADKSKKIAELTEAMNDKYDLRARFQKAVATDGYFGMSMIFLDIEGVEGDGLKEPLIVDARTIAKGKLRGFVNIEPMWVSPQTYNSTYPMKPDYYVPQMWYIMGKAVHHTRLLIIRSNELPDLLKPSYNFGGIAMSQMIKPYVDRWLRSQSSVSDLVHSFSLPVWKTTLQSLLANTQMFIDRIGALMLARDNHGVFAIDKETEEMTFENVPLSGLDALQAQSFEQLAAFSQLPMVKFAGITPAGLNVSADGEIRVFYDRVLARNEKVLSPALRKAIRLIQLSEFGDIDNEITFKWLPLWQLDEAGVAATKKTEADTDAVYIESGVVSQDEVRERLARDPESPYHGLEGDAPEMPEAEQSPDLTDTSESVEKRGTEGATTETNSGV